MCVCIYIYICMNICIYIYIYIYVCVIRLVAGLQGYLFSRQRACQHITLGVGLCASTVVEFAAGSTHGLEWILIHKPQTICQCNS